MNKIIYISIIALLLCSCGDVKVIDNFDEVGVLNTNTKKAYNIDKLFEVDGITVYRFKDGIKYVCFTKNNTYYIKNGTKLIGKTVYHTEEIIQSINTEEPDTLNINGLDYIKCDK